MSRQISTRIELDGEAEFKSAIKSINNELAELKSELALSTAEFDGQANSMAALTSKNEILTRQYETQSRKLEELKKMQAEANEAVNKAKDALDEVQKEYGENSEEAAQYAKRLENAESVQSKYNIQVNKAETELKKLSRELDDNKKYLKEAQESTDGCASSIDEFGKKVKTSRDNMEDAGKQGVSFGDILKANVASGVILTGIQKLAAGLKEVAEKLIECVKAGAAYADEIATLSITTSLSTDTLQEYQYMAELVDVSLNTITGSLRKMINNMDSARSGSSSAATAFEKLGVKVADSNGELRDSETVFLEVLDALGRIGSETERDAVAMDIFGRNAQDLNPLIKAGSEALQDLAKEAHDVGYVLDQETLGVLNDQQDSLDRLDKAWDTLKNRLAAEFAPAMTKATDALAYFLETAASGIGYEETAESYIQNLVDTIELLGPASEENIYALANVYEDLLNRLNVPFNWEQYSDLAAAISSARDAASAAAPELFGLAETIDSTASSVSLATSAHSEYSHAVRDGISEITERMTQLRESYEESYDAAYKSISSQIGLFEEMGSTTTQSIDDMISALESQVAYMDTYADNIKKAMEMGVDEGIVQQLSDGSKESAAYLQEIVNSGQDKIDELNDAFADVQEGKEDFSDAVAEMQTDFSLTLEQMSEDYAELVGDLDQFDEAMRAGENTILGLLEGLDSKQDAVRRKFVEVAKAGMDAYKDELGIQSPSKVFAEIGQYIMEGLAIGLENSKGIVMETSEDIVEEIKARFSFLADAFDLESDISELSYELWKKTAGKNATEEEKLLMRQQMLADQLAQQQGVLEAAQASYEEIAAQYGGSSTEAREMARRLLQEQIEYADLATAMDELKTQMVDAGLSDMLDSLESQLVDTVNTALFGAAAAPVNTANLSELLAGTVNGMQTAMTGMQGVGELSVRLVFPDGTELARYLLPDLISVARANGTPILNPS